MKNNPNKIEFVFAELKSKGLLLPSRKLQSSRFTQNFRSAIIFHNTISYNPKFCNMQEENIRFCLLHEEGHKIKPQYGPACLFFFSLIILCPLALFLIFYREYPILVFSSLIYSLILVLITLATLHESFHDDEHDSDLFAAEILRDSYGIKKPSYTVYNTLTELYSIMYPKNSEDVTIFDKLQFGLVDIHLHPPIDKRVEKIARIVDCY